MAQELPKYQTLVNWIRDQVVSNRLKYGEKFYSENELSAMFGISRQTVRQAVGILEQEKIVERRRGSGTYVIYNAPQVQRRQTMNIGVISTYLDDYIFTSIIRGIEKVLTNNGYSMQLTFTHNRVENETRALRTMLDKEVDGIIVEPTKSGLPNPNLDLYEEIHRREIPLVFFNAYYPGVPFPHVCLDDMLAGRMAAKTLIQKGHRAVAGIFQSDDLQGHLRYAGYLDALREGGLELHSEHTLWYTTEDFDYIEEDFRRILRCVQGCTGLVCYNDELAFRLVGILRKNGISVPEDLSIVSIDNSDLAAICEVPLTSVVHPMERLGKTAAENLLRLIADPAFDATVDFVPELVERGSVRKLGDDSSSA